MTKLNYRLGGIREMDGLPSLLFVIDVMREDTAIHEANILKIPVIAMVDTNANPDKIDHVIPSNDDAIRAIKLITAVIADAVKEGQGLRKDEFLDEIREESFDEVYDYEAEEDEEATDEEFLGEATLEKLRSGHLSFDDEVEDEDDMQLDSEEEAEADDAEAEDEEADDELEVAEEEVEAEADEE